ncbi:MAG TPA: twin-arginine translocase TatA/TatE family subunit [Candidatus Angelobacter sp.]
MFEGLAQPMHLLVLLLVGLLFFGPSKISDFGKGLGDGIRHFKDALKDGDGGQKADKTATTVAKTEDVNSNS